jgi:hypothetical protein
MDRNVAFFSFLIFLRKIIEFCDTIKKKFCNSVKFHAKTKGCLGSNTHPFKNKKMEKFRFFFSIFSKIIEFAT